MGQWSIPGGALEVGESLAEGVARELLEETGVAVEVLEVVEVLDRMQRLPAPDGRVKYHYVLIDYLCRPIAGAGSADPKPGSDASEARWVSRAEVADYALRPEMIEVIEKAFKRALV